jgi:hypothetical protein
VRPAPSAAPLDHVAQTYIVNGRQHVLVAVGDTLSAFKIY